MYNPNKISEKKIAVDCVHEVYIQPTPPNIVLRLFNLVESLHSLTPWGVSPLSSYKVSVFAGSHVII